MQRSNRRCPTISSRGPSRQVRGTVGVFLNRVCMFSSISVATLAAFVALIAIPAAYAQQQGAVYAAKAGDCLSGIVKAHYPNTTGHFFVLQSNPGIVDENRIEVGQEIVLPGLTADQVLSDVDQTGCNAASLAARQAAKSSIIEKAGLVASTRVSKQPAVADAEDKAFARKPASADTAERKIPAAAAAAVVKGATSAAAEVVASTIPVKSEAKKAAAAPGPVAPTPRKKPAIEAPIRKPAIAGTQAVPIDETQRTVAVAARGRPTRASAPMHSKPQFAVDEEQTGASYSYRQSTPNRYVVNAIGARTLTAANALVQHPDQHFYVESRADWQDAMSGHALERSNTMPTPASNPSSKTSTPLEEALAQTEEPKTQSAGNIFIDESLLLKAAAQPGGNP